MVGRLDDSTWQLHCGLSYIHAALISWPIQSVLMGRFAWQEQGSSTVIRNYPQYLSVVADNEWGIVIVHCGYDYKERPGNHVRRCFNDCCCFVLLTYNELTVHCIISVRILLPCLIEVSVATVTDTSPCTRREWTLSSNARATCPWRRHNSYFCGSGCSCTWTTRRRESRRSMTQGISWGCTSTILISWLFDMLQGHWD